MSIQMEDDIKRWTADRIRLLLGDAVVSAMKQLMGLALTAIAVEMLLAG